jgi:ketosteroid isomerase-like protein
MPDAHAVITRMYESGNTIIVEGRLVRTHTGPMAGPDGDVLPTGRTIDVPFADFSRIQEDQIATYRTYYDQVSLLTQLGLMPEPSG